MATDTITPGEYREKYEQLRRENAAMARGADLHNQAFEKLMKDAKTLQAHNARLLSDIRAKDAQIVSLTLEINNAGKVALDEVYRLRKVLADHGINADG